MKQIICYTLSLIIFTVTIWTLLQLKNTPDAIEDFTDYQSQNIA